MYLRMMWMMKKGYPAYRVYQRVYQDVQREEAPICAQTVEAWGICDRLRSPVGT